MVVGLELLHFVYAAGVAVLQKCEVARQCETEVVRIAVRTQNILASLQDATQHFSESVELRRSLLELKEIFENVSSLVDRCKRPVTLGGKAKTILQRKNPNHEALIQAERSLEQITQDLKLPLLAGIKHQLNRMEKFSQEALSAAASREVDTEELAKKIAQEINQAMDVSVGRGDITIRDKINTQVQHFQQEGEESVHLDTTDWNKATVKKTGRSKDSASCVGGLVHMLGRVRFEELEEGEIVGEGTFGIVLAGKYRGRDVAIKRSRGALGSIDILDEFRREAEIHYLMRHPKVVEIIAFGLGDSERRPCMIMELMQESLYDLLGVHGIALPMLDALSIIRDMCEGLEFLHAHGIMHRDLKSLNVLLDEVRTAKLSDFGLANVASSVASKTGSGNYSKVGSDFWMAPEVHMHCKATKSSDVFSLHVVMWEVLTRQRGGIGKSVGEQLLTNPSICLPLGELYCSELAQVQIRTLLRACGSKEKSQRPKMEEVCARVKEILNVLENQEESAEASYAQGAIARSSSSSTISRPRRRGSLSQMKSSPGSRLPPPPLPPRPKSDGSNGSLMRSDVRPPIPPPRLSDDTPPELSTRHPKLIRLDQGILEELIDKCAPLPLGLSSWTISTGWRKNSEWPWWFGVRILRENVVGGRDRVSQLSLPGNNLKGVMPEALSHLEYLTLLDLSNNEISGVLPASFGNLEFLASLNLSGTKIAGSIPAELGNMRAMRSLKIHHACLSGTIPYSLSGMSQALEELDLQNNMLEGEIPRSFGELVLLRTMRLGCNRLSGTIPVELFQLVRLEEMDLHGNNLTGEVVVNASWQSLRILDLADNSLTGSIPDGLSYLPSLKVLRLCRNFGLTGGIPQSLGNSQSLEELDLSATRLGGPIPDSLGNLRKLTMLSLGSCRLEGTIPPILFKLRYLKRLYLGDNLLQGPIPYQYLELPLIRSFNLERNRLQVSKETHAAIKRYLPKGCTMRL